MRSLASKSCLCSVVVTFLILVLSFVMVTLLFLTVSAIESAKVDKEYSRLNEDWIKKALMNNPVDDPRLDDDALRPVVNYDVEIIYVHNFKAAKEKKSFLVGEGWEVVGAVVDIIHHGETKYILYGRKNYRYNPGLWNNYRDRKKSFEDFLIIRRQGNHAEVLAHKRLGEGMEYMLLGLRLSKDAEGFEVIRDSPSGRPQVIWAYRF